MTQDYPKPIAPPPELVQQWADMIATHTDTAVFGAAAQWGADQELEACQRWLVEMDLPGFACQLRARRRPKPPSLKEQALARTAAILNDPNRALLIEVREVLELNLRALEVLPND
jgi:hypothetical protein